MRLAFCVFRALDSKPGGNMSTDAAAPPLPRLLTADQVAEQTGIPKSRVYELSRTGDLPAISFGRRYRYDPNELRSWLASGGTARDC